MSRRQELQNKIRELKDLIHDLRKKENQYIDDVNYWTDKLDTKEKEFKDEDSDIENDFTYDTNWGASASKINNEYDERQQKERDVQYQKDNESYAIKNNLREAKDNLRGVKKDLADAKRELQEYQDRLNLLPSENSNHYEYESYEEPSKKNHNNYNEFEEEEESYDYTPTDNYQPKKPQAIKPQKRNDGYDIHRAGLWAYAQASGKSYKELNTLKGEYRACVGNTFFDYRNPDDLVVNCSNGNPSIDDFKAIFKIERNLGRRSLPIGNMNNKEYQARLIAGAFEAGIVPSGAIKLSEADIQKLSPETQSRYQEQIQIHENKLAQRKKNQQNLK